MLPEASLAGQTLLLSQQPATVASTCQHAQVHFNKRRWCGKHAQVLSDKYL
jgi:hypothetical protein